MPAHVPEPAQPSRDGQEKLLLHGFDGQGAGAEHPTRRQHDANAQFTGRAKRLQREGQTEQAVEVQDVRGWRVV